MRFRLGSSRCAGGTATRSACDSRSPESGSPLEPAHFKGQEDGDDERVGGRSSRSEAVQRPTPGPVETTMALLRTGLHARPPPMATSTHDVCREHRGCGSLWRLASGSRPVMPRGNVGRLGSRRGAGEWRTLLSAPSWGRSSVGRALPLQGRGRRFESGRLHRDDSPSPALPRMIRIDHRRPPAAHTSCFPTLSRR